VDNVTEGGAQIGSGAWASARGQAGSKRLTPAARDGQLQLFEPGPDVLDPAVKALLDDLRALDPNALSPLEALALLDKLAKRAKL
jgi:hypothetical protein